jgi:hypothetical protein
MPTVQCPECDRHIRLEPHEVGLRITCAQCDTSFETAPPVRHDGRQDGNDLQEEDDLQVEGRADRFATEEPEPWFYRHATALFWITFGVGLIGAVLPMWLLFRRDVLRILQDEPHLAPLVPVVFLILAVFTALAAAIWLGYLVFVLIFLDLARNVRRMRIAAERRANG